MDKLSFYTVDEEYINYLRKFDSKVMDSKLGNRNFERPFVGILLTVNNFNYIAPLSSFKPKHNNMKDTLDFIKIGTYSVININDMIPVKNEHIKRIEFKDVQDPKYKELLKNEYEIVNSKRDKIQKNANVLYNKVTKYRAPISQRCCDFELLEKKSLDYNIYFSKDQVNQIDNDTGAVHIYEFSKAFNESKYFVGHNKINNIERVNDFSSLEGTKKIFSEFKEYEKSQVKEMSSKSIDNGVEI